MALIHHRRVGSGRPAIVLVHGFGCALSDWSAQVAALSPRHETVAVDLRGHGATPGKGAECSIEVYGADVAALVRELRLAPAVLVGHSMGCRVVLEAARVVGKDVVGLVLVDGSRLGFPGKGNDKAMADRFAAGEYETIVKSMFEQMFTARSDKAKAAAVIERAMRLPNDVGRKMLPDLIRYDADKLDAVLETVAVPLLVIQSTYTNEQRQRMTMRAGETTPYLDLVRGKVRGARVEIVPDTGHFPQIDTPSEVNRLIDTFAAGIGKG